MNELPIGYPYFIRWLADDIKLSKEVRSIIANLENIIFVSSASTWGITIKITRQIKFS